MPGEGNLFTGRCVGIDEVGLPGSNSRTDLTPSPIGTSTRCQLSPSANRWRSIAPSRLPQIPKTRIWGRCQRQARSQRRLLSFIKHTVIGIKYSLSLHTGKFTHIYIYIFKLLTRRTNQTNIVVFFTKRKVICLSR